MMSNQTVKIQRSKMHITVSFKKYVPVYEIGSLLTSIAAIGYTRTVCQRKEMQWRGVCHQLLLCRKAYNKVNGCAGRKWISF